MKWSLRVGRLFGIPLYVHFTFFLFLVWVAAESWRMGGSTGGALVEVLFMCALFGCVVLHELGHALTARRFGIRTRDITLLPIGGVARLERMPDDPKQELLVALAGPAVNVALAALLFGVVTPAAWHQVQWVGAAFLSKPLWVNVTRAGFNPIPASPRDGGRALRAVHREGRD